MHPPKTFGDFPTNGIPRCNWHGPRYFIGANSCDDYMLECYNTKLYSIKSIQDCKVGYRAPGHISYGAPACNFQDYAKVNGVKRGDDFGLTCNNDGMLDSVMFTNRRLGLTRHEPDAAEKNETE